jgi:hypothetical protein
MFRYFYLSVLSDLIKPVVFGDTKMSKREIIDFICQINRTARPEFLARFPISELSKYLDHLMEIDTNNEVQLVEA